MKTKKSYLKILFLITFLTSVLSFGQQEINGVVTDSDSIPLSGANIVEKGTTNGVTADFDGNFTIQVSDDSAVLVFSYIGFATREVAVGNQGTINVNLEESAAGLDEVVVVGYGTKRKRDIVSAVSVVDMKEVKDVPATDASRLLLGQAPGVVVGQTSGRPGQELNIVVRGLSSLGADSKPLYVIDGFPVGTSTGLSIDPADIESMTVLKDAASTAIYGARGSNGVILINTKQGKSGRTSVTLDIVSGLQQIPDARREKVLNAQEFGQFQKESWIDKFILSEGRDPTESEIPLRVRNPEQYTTSTDYRQFDFNAVFTGAENYDIYRNFESTTLNLDGVFNVDIRAKERFRSAENPGNGRVPTSNFWKWERESNSFYVHDASHMWLRSMSLGYTLPLKSDALLSNARIYINADNLYLWSDFPGGNPQVSTAGGINPGRDDSAYPVPRTVTLGATLSF